MLRTIDIINDHLELQNAKIDTLLAIIDAQGKVIREIQSRDLIEKYQLSMN